MFLNVLEIKKLAYRKGCVAERTMTVGGKPHVRLTDPKGREIDCARRDIGFSLIEAKRHLEALPDHSRDQRGKAANRSAPQPNWESATWRRGRRTDRTWRIGG